MKKVFVTGPRRCLSPPPPPLPPSSAGGPAAASAAGAQFTANRTALSAASSAFDQAFVAWERSGKPITQTASFADAYVSALESQGHTLISQSWPAGAIADIDAVVRGDAAVEGVVSALPGLPSSSSVTDWFIAFDQDAAIGVADANIVRHDLGIPLASYS